MEIIETFIYLITHGPKYLRNRYNVRVTYMYRLKDKHWYKEVKLKEELKRIKLEKRFDLLIESVDKLKEKKSTVVISETPTYYRDSRSQIPKSKNPPPPTKILPLSEIYNHDGIKYLYHDDLGIHLKEHTYLTLKYNFLLNVQLPIGSCLPPVSDRHILTIGIRDRTGRFMSCKEITSSEIINNFTYIHNTSNSLRKGNYFVNAREKEEFLRSTDIINLEVQSLIDNIQLSMKASLEAEMTKDALEPITVKLYEKKNTISSIGIYNPLRSYILQSV